jgi:predicted DNA-binding transcriptional regulator YafY
VERNRWHQSQIQRELPDGRLEVTFTANGIEGVKYWLYRWLPYMEVVAPHALRDAVAQELKIALKKHGGKA